jgi:4-amino-4-deoxy-L-arabinose transferase-like glycosyltransferase
LAILLLAFGLRLYRLDTQSFAFDEGWTSYAIHHSWWSIWGVLAPDNHPPAYYVLVKAFADLAGYGDLSLRFVSVMCGMVLVAGLCALGRRLGGEVMGLSAALFTACAPSFVYYAQEARMYSLLMALAVLSSYSLLRFSENMGCRHWWVAYVLTTSAALYTHYFALLLLVAQNVLWLLWCIWGLVERRQQRKAPFPIERVKWWALGQASILVLYLPWLPTAVRQVSIGQGTWWRMPLPASVIARDVWRFYVLGPRRPAGVPSFGPWLGAIALTGLVALFLGWRRRPRAWVFVLVTLVVPVGLVVLAGSRLPVYTDRYTLVAAPGLALAVGLGIAACWEALTGAWAWLGRVAAMILLVAVVIAPLPQLRAAYDDPTYWREDFRRAAAYVEQKATAEDTVVMVGSWQPVTHYYRGPANLLRFPQSGDSVQSEEEVVSLLREHVQPGGSVRLVMYSWETVDPQGLVEGQLRAHCEIRGEHWQRETGQRPIRVMNFAACDNGFAVEPRRALEAVWGDQVALDGYRLVNFSPGRQAHVVLWWRTLRRPDRDYSVFVHLLDDQGHIIKQFDKLPLSDFYPMRAWPPNVDQRDDYPLKIPVDADLEGAWLAIGLYDARNGRRLPVVQEGVHAGDSIRVPVTQ